MHFSDFGRKRGQVCYSTKLKNKVKVTSASKKSGLFENFIAMTFTLELIFANKNESSLDI